MHVLLCSDFQVRLVGGRTSYMGNVEIHIGGQWRSVCSTHRSRLSRTETANVVCRSLGFTGGDSLGSGTFGSAVSPVGLIDPR